MGELVVVDSRKAKERSPTFPFINLRDALDRAKQFYVEERRGSTAPEIAAAHWRYSPSSSGAQQTVSALKSYGLLADQGGGKERKIRLTEHALRIILDDRPDSPDRMRYMQEAALQPAVAAEVYRMWPNGLPSSATLNHFLVLDKKFTQQTALKVSKIIQQNHEFANLTERDPLSDNDEVESEESSEEERPVNQNRADAIAGAMLASRNVAAGVMRVGDRVGGAKQVGASIPVTKGCSMSITATGNVTQEGLEKLILYINLIKGSFPASDSEAE